jgi:hypothetical protein
VRAASTHSMSVLGTTALCHACGTQAAFTELSISETGFRKREVDIASPRRRLQIQVDGLSPTHPEASPATVQCRSDRLPLRESAVCSRDTAPLGTFVVRIPTSTSGRSVRYEVLAITTAGRTLVSWRIDWSDSWSDEDLDEFSAASLRSRGQSRAPHHPRVHRSGKGTRRRDRPGPHRCG